MYLKRSIEASSSYGDDRNSCPDGAGIRKSSGQDHMVFDCSALESHRWNHPSLLTVRGSRSLSDFMDQDPTDVAAFVFRMQEVLLGSC